MRTGQGACVRSDPQPIGDKRNRDIEILRGIAIGFVMVEHLLGMWDLPSVHRLLSDYLSFWGGVDLFFVISGYVIALSVLRSAATLENTAQRIKALVEFWIRRVWRLWPAAWFWLLLPFVAVMLFDPQYRTGDGLRDNCAAVLGAMLNVTNIQVWRAKIGLGMSNVFWGQYWSLALEEQFYLVAAPLLLFIARRWVAGLMVALIVGQLFFARAANGADLSWYVRSDGFAWGVLIALVWNSRFKLSLIEPTILRQRRYAWPLLAIVLLAICSTQLLYSVPFDVSIIAAASAALVFVASFDKGYLGVGGVMGRILSWVGDRSYAIYLAHGCILAVGLRIGPLAHIDRQHVGSLAELTVMFIVITLILAELSHRFIEVPARIHGRRLAKAYHARCAGSGAGTGNAYPVQQQYSSVETQASN
jgi:peptidoglycan/LPS O-acetylase OafA/YrhL